MIEVAATVDPSVRNLLAGHPRVASLSDGMCPLGWRHDNGWERRIVVGDVSDPLYGLTELVDNNPLVCADRFSLPSPAVALALIALGPLALAGMVASTPTMVVNVPVDEVELEAALSKLGFSGGVLVHHEPIDIGPVLAATVMVEVPTLDDPDELADAFDERFGRSFFVRRDAGGEWDPARVEGQPFALYRLRVAPDRPRSLVTIRVMADRQGKAGAAQVVHAMNVMCGFEESLGLG
jgi:hypothetical protein